MNNISRREEDKGIFSYLVNQAAFVDKVVVAVSGTRRKKNAGTLAQPRNYAIGGPTSFYARCIATRHLASGNDMQLKYGVMRPYPDLSPFVLTLWSGGQPVTCADLLLCLDGLMRKGHRARISLIELTFDTHSIPLWRFRRDLCCRAQVEEFRGSGEPTLYVGSASSPWGMRMYRKVFVNRIEFILRSPFLRTHGISSPQQVYQLKRADLWHQAYFRVVNAAAHEVMPRRMRETWLNRGLTVPPVMPASIVERELRGARISPRPWLATSACEILLRKMQSNLIW